MRKLAFLIIAIVGMLLAIGLLMIHSLAVMQRIAAVQNVQGMVWIRPRGQTEFRPLGEQAQVAAGDTIKTSANGQVDLYWLDKTRMRIGPNSQVTVLKSHFNFATHADMQIFKLDVGRVWLRVLKLLSQKSKFEIVTPTATAGVRGTIFSVAVLPHGETVVSVKEGKVIIATKTARTVEVDAGQMMRGNGVRPLDKREIQLWEANQEVMGPILEVRTPRPGQKIPVGGRLVVSGLTEPDVTLTINGQPAPLKLKRFFSVTLHAPATPGPHTITLEARDARGLSSRQRIPVEIIPPAAPAAPSK